jgi:hypothetical protein
MKMINKGDLEVAFYEHHNGETREVRVGISLGGSRATTSLSLDEFCELLAECRTAIIREHWGPSTNRS